ncbi:unnamed protein product, partial [Pylaiella littoralis]
FEAVRQGTYTSLCSWPASQYKCRTVCHGARCVLTALWMCQVLRVDLEIWNKKESCDGRCSRRTGSKPPPAPSLVSTPDPAKGIGNRKRKGTLDVYND